MRKTCRLLPKILPQEAPCPYGGIADKVIEQFKQVYPEKIPEFETYNRNVIIAHSYYHSMYSSAQRAMQAKRASGGGGRASFGGGGGFSGGGRGGGSR